MISGDLEYFMSSLPYLSFQNTPEIRERVAMLLETYAGPGDHRISLVRMLEEEAKKFMSAEAYILFSKVDLDTVYQTAVQQSRNQMLADFSKFAFELREKVRQLRLFRKGSDGKTAPDQKEVFLEGTPLEEEIQLLKFQWDRLELLSVENYANLEALIIYKLKLMLLLRWWNFDSVQGYERFLQLVKDH